MDKNIVKSVIATVLRPREKKEMEFSPIFRPTTTIDGAQHSVLKIRVAENGDLESNVVNDLWSKISFEPKSNGYIDPEILMEFIGAELKREKEGVQ